MSNLIVFKIWSCRLRSTKEKKEQDSDHAKELLKHLGHPPTLSTEQRTVVEEGLETLLQLRQQEDEEWWRKALGLSL